MNKIQRARELRKIITDQMQNLEDADALKYPELYDRWSVGFDYKKDTKLRFGGVLYKVLQDHKSQADWLPSVTPSLYAEVLIPDPEVIPEWVQPGAGNAYMKGDKVKHNGETWQSLIDNNVWEPGTPGTENLWQKL